MRDVTRADHAEIFSHLKKHVYRNTSRLLYAVETLFFEVKTQKVKIVK